MSTPLPSLLSAPPAPAQLSFFAEDEIGSEYIGSPARQGQYTGEELYRDRPEVYREVVRLLADPTVSIRAIKRMCKVHHLTIEAIAQREAVGVDTHRKALASLTGVAARVTIERFLEVVDEIKPDNLMVSGGILIDKLQLLSGGVTSRVGREIPTDDLRGDLQKLIDALPAADAQVIDAVETGSLASPPKQMDPTRSGEVSGLSGSASDMESDVLEVETSVMRSNDAAEHTPSSGPLPHSDQASIGGEGVGFEPGGSDTSIGHEH